MASEDDHRSGNRRESPNTFSRGDDHGFASAADEGNHTTFRTASGSSGQQRRGKELRGELTEHEFVMQIVAGVASRRVSAPLRISEHLVTATSIRPFVCDVVKVSAVIRL